jgi:magnesium-transporting ATPase (P-type)
MKENKKNSVHWHALDSSEVISKLNSSESGLSINEAANRLSVYGLNKISRKSGDSILVLIWRQINNPLIWVLLGATLLAIILGKITDGLVVLAVVVINTIIGFLQEYKAGKAIEALIDMVPQNATVVRDEKNMVVPVAELIPGDIVLLASGERVPADMRIIAQKNLHIDEATLTGESVLLKRLLKLWMLMLLWVIKPAWFSEGLL